MSDPAHTAAGERLHWLLDEHGEDVALRNVADDLQQSGAMGPAIRYAYAQSLDPGPNAEFWRRLLGSLRKAATL